MRFHIAISFVVVVWSSPLRSQTPTLLFHEDFDSASVPQLPAGWTSSTGTTGGRDFQTLTGTAGSTVRSAPNAAGASNARTAKWLRMPPLDFSGKAPDSLIFWERRSSSSFDASLYLSAGVDSAAAETLAGPFLWSGKTTFIRRAIALPDTLAGNPSILFSWIIVPSAAGGVSSTIRFDDIAITAQRVRDLAVDTLIIPSGFHPVKEPIPLLVRISNAAKAGVFDGRAELWDRFSADTLFRLVAVGNFNFVLGAGETRPIGMDFLPGKAGRHQLAVKLVVEGDENASNDSALATVNTGYRSGSLLINEIMYAPANGPEWVELMNVTADTVSLASWRIGDAGATRPLITAQDVRVPPRAFVVVARDLDILEPFPNIPSPVVTCSLPSLNNDGDAVVIVEPSGSVVDSVRFSSTWGGVHGVSLERIDTNVASTDRSSWGSSCDPGGATPGRPNSIFRKMIDAALTGVELYPPLPTMGNTAMVEVALNNRGRNPVSGCIVRCYADGDRDSLVDPGEEIGSKAARSLSAGDSVKVRVAVDFKAAGEQLMIINAELPGDEITANNQLRLPVSVGTLPGSLVINEIMYAPEGDMPEWVECRNIGPASVSLQGWRIADGESRSRVSIANRPVDIAPGGYVVIASDSSLIAYVSIPCPLLKVSIPALNNISPDAVVLYDASGVMMDSVRYSPTWGGGGGKSLERVSVTASSNDSANWRSRVPTPGFENSVVLKAHDLALGRVWNIACDSVGVVIRNEGSETAEGFQIRLSYDADGDRVADAGEAVNVFNFAGPLGSGDSTSVSIGWLPEKKGNGSLIVSILWDSDERLLNNSMALPVSIPFAPSAAVINEILFEASSGTPEFVEIFNRSQDTLALEGWTLRDAPTANGSRVTSSFSDTHRVLMPGSCAVIAADSSIVEQYGAGNAGSVLVVTGRELGLGNSGDDVVLSDQTGRVIDSVRYDPAWFHDGDARPGRSLERISPVGGSCDGRNWSGSAAVSGSTPGRRNSLFTPAPGAQAGLLLSPNPFSPDGDGFEDNLVISYRLTSAASTIRVRIYDITGREIRTLADREAAAPAGMIVWDGRDNDGRRARIGMYIIYFESLGVFGGEVEAWKAVAVVAGRM